MIIEGVGSVTLVNGILKIQTLETNAEGNVQQSGTIEIPGNRVNDVINSLVSSAKEVSEKIATALEDQKTTSQPDDSSTNGKTSKKKKKK